MGVPTTGFGVSVAGVLLSSMVGLGDAMTFVGCCAFVFCCGIVLEASFIGSVSPPEATQAFQPPRSARALKPLSRSICAARALVCSCGQEQYVTISRSVGNSDRRVSSWSSGM
jgi:hypothetical protein